MRMMTNARKTYQRNQRKERPNGNPTTFDRRDLTAVADRPVDGVLLIYLDVGLRLLRGDLNTRQHRGHSRGCGGCGCSPNYRVRRNCGCNVGSDRGRWALSSGRRILQRGSQFELLQLTATLQVAHHVYYINKLDGTSLRWHGDYQQ